MKVTPRFMLAAIAALGVTGCRTLSPGPSQRITPLTRERLSFRIEEFVEEHNRNAERIRSLRVNKLPITVTGIDRGKKFEAAVDGRLALEQPRNFKLEMRSHLMNMANLGSNEERFWFWVKNDRSIYVCDYADLETTQLAVSYQPDWIVEAIGLKTIGPDEASSIKIRPGITADTTLLVFPARINSGQSSTREMVVSELTGRVTELRILEGKTLVARALIKKYLEIPIPAPRGVDQAEHADTCFLPGNMTLDWTREQLSLDVTVPQREVVLNPSFDPSQRTSLFVEPTIPGHSQVNLAELGRPRKDPGQTSVRETMPAPPRNRVRLSPPTPIRDDQANSKLTAPVAPEELNNRPYAPLLVLDDVVGVPMPKTPGEETSARTPNTAWAGTGTLLPR